MNQFLKRIHREDIYKDFKPLPFQSENNNIDDKLEDIFGSYENEDRTVIIIEAGSWKGSSAIAMANYFKNKDINPPYKPIVFCVDTFLGSSYHRIHGEFFEMLKCKNGFPTLYQQFLSNVIHSNLQNNIIPIPQTSHDAARYLKHLNISADFCFLDAGHEYDDVVSDIKDYWDLVIPGGTLFGDDYDGGWRGVMDAVDEFILENKLEDKSKLFDSIWAIRKEK